MSGKGLHGVMVKSAQDDGVDVTADDAGEIRNAFAGAEADFRPGQKDTGPAQLGHGGLETDSRSERRLFEHQAQDLAQQ